MNRYGAQRGPQLRSRCIGTVRSRAQLQSVNQSCTLLVKNYLGSLGIGQSLKILSEYITDRRPGSVVTIATAYGLDGPGIESRWGRDFP